MADLQQMTNPMRFIEQTIDHYNGLTLDEIKDAFVEIEAECRRMQEEGRAKK